MKAIEAQFKPDNTKYDDCRCYAYCQPQDIDNRAYLVGKKTSKCHPKVISNHTAID